MCELFKDLNKPFRSRTVRNRFNCVCCNTLSLRLRTRFYPQKWSVWSQTFFVSCIGTNIPVLTELPLSGVVEGSFRLTPRGPSLHLYWPLWWQVYNKKAHDWSTTHKVKTQQVTRNRGQWCGDIELTGYLKNVTGPVPLVLDLGLIILNITLNGLFWTSTEYLWGCDVKVTHSSITLGNLSFINFVSIFKCSSPSRNPGYVSRVDPPDLPFSLSSHRHSHISLLFNFRFVINKKDVYTTDQITLDSLHPPRPYVTHSHMYMPFLFIMNRWNES
jgi:hypothetical protein